MNNTNLELFKQALLEGVSNRIDREIESCTETIVCSKRHKAAMKRIINGKYKESETRSLGFKKVVAILVAALLLLASCAIVYRNEIRNFIEEIYDSFIRLSYSEGENPSDEIEGVYELSYIPNGYSQQKEEITLLKSSYVFSNSNGNTMMFEQRVLDAVTFYTDVENGYKKIVDVNIYDVYYKETKYQKCYMWNDGKYTLRLISDVGISTEELILIINGIKEK